MKILIIIALVGVGIAIVLGAVALYFVMRVRREIEELEIDMTFLDEQDFADAYGQDAFTN